MGQAKRRGTHEQRKALAVERVESNDIRRRLEAVIREENMTPEQKEERHRTTLLLAAMSGIIASTKYRR